MALSKMDLSPFDFKSSESTRIQYKESHINIPPGTFTDFEVKGYCPAVFRHLQELENIDYEDYMQSISGHETLMEISSPGKSGCLLFLSKDDRFVVKTLRKSEVKVLLKMLPNYLRHIKQFDASLLTKLYGLHFVRPIGGPKVYFVVMGNIFKSDLHMHRFYDLKGSSQGRTFGKVGDQDRIIFKDLDLDFCFYLNPLIQHQLLAQIKHDCQFLEAEDIMDYSFLLGIHIEGPHQGLFDKENQCTKTAALHDALVGHANNELTFADIWKKPDSHAYKKLGVRVPARAVRVPTCEKESALGNQDVGVQECYDAFLNFGIVDILQGYNMRKRIEHAYKSVQYDSRSISAVNPKAYSTRFQDFLCRVFQAETSNL